MESNDGVLGGTLVTVEAAVFAPFGVFVLSAIDHFE